VCPGTSTTLSLSGSTIANSTYQWQSSSDNTNWSNISGATSATYLATPAVSTYYRCAVTCTAAATTLYSSSVQVVVTILGYASVPFSEGFEGPWINSCNTRDVPSSNWVNAPNTGNNSWRRNDDGATAAWSSATSGAYSPTFSAGAYSARFHSYITSSVGSMDLYINLSSAGTKTLSFDYINTSGSDVLDVLLSTDGGLTFPTTLLSLTPASVWTVQQICISAVSSTAVIRFKADGDAGSTDIGIDNLSVNPACSGTPAAGTANASSSSICLGESSTISLSGNATGCGISYQWQSSFDNSAWANISGATSLTYNATPTGSTYYRCVVTCSNSGLSENSVSALVSINNCMLIGNGTLTTSSFPYKGSYDDERTQIIYTAAELSALGVLPGTTLNSLAFNVSTKYSSQAYKGFTVKIAHTSSSTFGSVAWLTPTFTEVFNTNYSTATGWNTHSFSPGFTWDGFSNIVIEACYNNNNTTDYDMVYYTSVTNSVCYNYANSETGCTMSAAYTSSYRPNAKVTYTPPSACSGTPTGGTALANPATACSGGQVVLSVSGGTFATGLTYQWQSSSDNSSWSNISGATSLSCSASISVNTYYRRATTCTSSGLSANSASVFVPVVGCYPMDNNPISTCTGYFYDSGGSTGQYSNSQNLTKTFTSDDPASVLQFVFTSFATESGNDFLYIYDGPNTSSPQVTGSPFSGSTSPGTIVASGSSLTFKFTSDVSVLYDGWAAAISCVPMTPPNCATFTSPADASVDLCPGTGVPLTWSAGSGGFAPSGYSLYFGTNNPPTNVLNGSDLGNVTTYNTGPLLSNTTYYWKILPYNNAGENSSCTTVRSFTTTNVSVTGTNSPISTCQNTYALTATGSGTLNWYNVATGGAPIGTGSPYNATFSGNTTYYVGATVGSTSDYTTGHPGPNNSTASSSSMGIRFTTYAALTIKTVNVYITNAGTNLTVRLENTSYTDLETKSFTNLPSGLNTLTLNFTISTPGNYILMSEDGVSMGYTDPFSSYPYTVSGIISLTSGEWWGSDATIYGYFYNWIVSSGSNCESARTPVIITHTASPITITPNGPTTFLSGGSVGLTASSAASPAYTYTWSPATGLNTTIGTTVTASPTDNIVYTVTGTNGSCTNTQTIAITVTQPCTGLGTGVSNLTTLPFTHSGQTTCGDVDDITSANAIIGGSSSYYTGEDYVYTFTPSVSGSVTISLTSTGSYTGLMLYQGCPMNGQGGICIAYNQSSTGSKSMCVSVNADNPYYLILDSYDSPDCNPYSITISEPDPSGTPNDLPCYATTLSVGGIELGDNTCATGGGEPVVPSCWTAGNVNTLWYKIVAPASGSLKIKTILGSLTNTQIAVYQGNCSGLSLVANACNDDYTDCSNDYTESSLSLTGLTAGNTYYIAVDGYSSLVGTFSITAINGTSSWPGIPQQDCSSTTAVCGAQTVVGNPGFTGSGSNCDFSSGYGCLSSGELNSAWYMVTTDGAAGNFTFSITPTASTDYDWGVWDVTGITDPCSGINGDDETNLIRCSYSAISGATGLNTTALDNSEGSGGDGWCAQIPIPASVKVFLINIQNYSSNNNGFTLDLESTPGNYNIPTTLTWSGASGTAWNNAANWGGCTVPLATTNVIIVNGPANQPIINAAGAICKSVQIINGASLTINSGYQLEVKGDFENLGTLNLNSSSSILMSNASVVQNLNGMITGANKFGNFTITKTGGSVSANQDFEIGGTFTTSNSTSILSSTTSTIKIGGNVSLGGSGTLNCSNIEFNGTGTQTLTNSSGSLTLTNGTINNTGGGLSIGTSANNSIYINGILTLTQGIITPTAPALLVMNVGSSVSGGSVLSYVNGPMQKIGNTAFTFPLGKSLWYAQLGVAASTNAANTFTAEYFRSACTNNSSSYMNSLDHVSYLEYWNLTRDAGTEYPAVTLYWEDASTVVEKAAPYDSISDLCVAHWNTSTSKWDDMAGNGTGTWPSGQITSTVAFSSYSPISFGSKTGKNPLPVELKGFYGICNDKGITLLWSTASETNCDYFAVEKSDDGNNWTYLGKANCEINSNETREYHFKDSDVQDASYYRLTQFDIDGKQGLEKVIYVNCNNSENIVAYCSVYPNPASDMLTVEIGSQTEQDITFILNDPVGKKIKEFKFHLMPGFNKLQLILPDIADGVYYLKHPFVNDIPKIHKIVIRRD